MPKLSVIIPVYNAAPYLRECLDSVLGQTLREIEVLCVNDGSTDDSEAILTEYAARDSRIKVFAQSNAGQGAARNRALDEARGKYIWFVDADDALPSNDSMAKAFDECERLNLEVLFFDAITTIDDDIASQKLPVNAKEYIRIHDYSKIVSGRELWSKLLKNKEYTVSPCLMMLNRSFVENAKLRFPLKRIFFEDNIFASQLLLSASRVTHRPWKLYNRKVHAGSTVMRKYTLRHLSGYLACYLDACEILSKGKWDFRTRRVLNERCVVYKLHVRRILDSQVELLREAEVRLPPEELRILKQIQIYPLSEKIINGFRCFRDRGLLFTIRRIFLGRQS